VRDFSAVIRHICNTSIK